MIPDCVLVAISAEEAAEKPQWTQPGSAIQRPQEPHPQQGPWQYKCPDSMQGQDLWLGGEGGNRRPAARLDSPGRTVHEPGRAASSGPGH